MARKAQQAKHLADAAVLAAVRDIGATRRQTVPCSWAFTWDLEIQPEFAGVHFRVLAAKCKALIRRNLLSGCACGCRGDFEVTETGAAVCSHVPRRKRALKYP